MMRQNNVRTTIFISILCTIISLGTICRVEHWYLSYSNVCELLLGLDDTSSVFKVLKESFIEGCNGGQCGRSQIVSYLYAHGVVWTVQDCKIMKYLNICPSLLLDTCFSFRCAKTKQNVLWKWWTVIKLFLASVSWMYRKWHPVLTVLLHASR